ncbi:tetratricopeptide repeat protein [Moheibacter sediminis]|nr:tetratricopeptide repeat protein [Moheibacter sediminis]
MIKNILFFFFLVTVFVSVCAQSDAKDYIIGGNQLYAQKDYAKAELQYKQALSKDANSIKANYNLGNSLYHQKKYDESRAHYYKIIKNIKSSKADKHKAFHNIGKTYLDENEPEKAVQNLKEALRFNPYDEQTRYNYALARKMLEEQKKQDQNKDQQKDQNKGDKNQENPESGDKNESEQEKNKGNQQNQGQGGNEEGEGNQPKDQQITKGSDGKGQDSRNAMNKEYQEGVLRALEQQEQETLKKIISQKAKKVRTNTEKDW